MKDIQINSAAFSFIGLFPYDEKLVNSSIVGEDYEPLNFYKDNKDYFDQKYYSNWIHSFFRDSSDEKSIPRHLKLKASSSLFEKELFVLVGEDQKMIKFEIREVNVFFFEANLGIFVLKIDLPAEHFNWEDIVSFGSTFRQTTINKKYKHASLSIQIIEEFITSKFNTNHHAWRQYNPLLKSAIYIDIDKQLEKEVLDKLLYQVGTYSVPFVEDDLFAPDDQYYQDVVKENGISPFKNWKALCLYDSLSRIAINLNEKDTHKLWENEYILIYIYVLYARYFLHHTNNQLTQIFEDSKLVENQRNNFYRFKNVFNHAKISYKFLPNIIHNKLKSSLDIKEELGIIEDKLTRVNVLRQEKYQTRINGILFMLTLLTLISVGYDGGEMLDKWEWSQSLAISLSIIAFVSIIIILLFFTNVFKKK